MKKYTVGPWHLGDQDAYNEVFDTKGRIVAKVFEYHDGQGRYWGRDNTKLIAAAPDLFETLKTVWVNIPSHILAQYGLNEEEILTVLSKAKGGLQ